MQAPRPTSDVTAEAFKVASRRLLPVSGAIWLEEGGTNTIDNDDGDSSAAAHLVDDRDRQALPPHSRPGKGRISLNGRNAAVRSQHADERLDSGERCARSSPSARR